MTRERLTAGGEAVEIVSTSPVDGELARVGAHGSLVGRIEAISSHGQLRFTLHKMLRGDPTTCYFHEDQIEQVRKAWGHQVQVVGWVVREASSGSPLEIRRVRQVIPLDEGDAPDFRTALGAIPWQEGMPTAVEAIRWERDGYKGSTIGRKSFTRQCG